MIQRVQSIYLALSALACGFMLFFPFVEYMLDQKQVFYFNALGLIVSGKNLISFPMWMLILINILISITTIFMYKNRPWQLKMGRFSYLFQLVVVVVIFLFTDRDISEFGIEASTLSIEYQPALAMPLAAIGFTFLANRAIKRDEELVKSLDRLR